MKKQKNKDSWCAPLLLENGNKISGGAARNRRIKDSGGMDNIIDEVAREAAGNALDRANKRSQPKLKLVVNNQ